MSFRLPIDNCLDEHGEPHYVTLHDDGTMTFDGNHDPDLELALGELGAKLPPCILVYQAWVHDPFRLIANASRSIAYQYGTQMSYVMRAVITSLGIDFLRHVEPPSVHPDRIVEKNYNSLMERARVVAADFLDISVGKKHVDIRKPYPTDHIVRARDILQSSQFSVSLASLTYSPRYHWYAMMYEADKRLVPLALAKMHMNDLVMILDKLASACTHLAGDPQVIFADYTNDPHDAAEEAAWQRRHMIKGITCLMEGKPWPEVKP